MAYHPASSTSYHPHHRDCPSGSAVHTMETTQMNTLVDRLKHVALQESQLSRDDTPESVVPSLTTSASVTPVVLPSHHVAPVGGEDEEGTGSGQGLTGEREGDHTGVNTDKVYPQGKHPLLRYQEPYWWPYRTNVKQRCVGELHVERYPGRWTRKRLMVWVLIFLASFLMVVSCMRYMPCNPSPLRHRSIHFHTVTNQSPFRTMVVSS
jgi:hypothetical protein